MRLASQLIYAMTQCDQTGKGPSEKEAIRLFTCSRERRYKAAVAIYLAAYTYSVMAPAERARGDTKVYADMKSGLTGFSPMEFQKMWSPPMRAAWRAYAMLDLGIPPAIEGEIWSVPKSRRILWGVPNGPNKLFIDYRASNEATSRAQSYLEAKGMDARALEDG